MRWAVVALGLGLAACNPSNIGSGDSAPVGGYTLEVRVSQDAQSYLVIAPDGRVVGARAAEGASALMDTGRAQALAGEPAPPEDAVQAGMSIRLPGFSMNIAGTDEDPNGENGSVNLSIGGERNVIVRANEGGPGEADDTAYVHITGADEQTVRDFIDDAEGLSAETKTQMLGALGLN